MLNISDFALSVSVIPGYHFIIYLWLGPEGYNSNLNMSTCHHKSGRKRTQNLAILFLTYLNFKPRLKLKRETKVRFARFVAVGHWTGVCTAVFSISKVQAKNQIRERNRMIHIMIRTLCWRGTLDRCMYCRLRDAPQKNKRDFLGIFPKGGGGGLFKSQNFCKFTKCFFVCQNHS